MLHRRISLAITLSLAVLGSLLGVACGASTGGSSSSGAPVTINVFAASSLTDAFTKLGAQFTLSHPGVKVVFNFAGSQSLVAQMEQGAPADVFASADAATMDKVKDLVRTPRTFAANKLEIVVPIGNPQHISGLADLARADLKVVLAAAQVPAGKYAAEVLAAQHVTVKPVSLEDSVKGVVTKISLGEADAGIAYVTDVTAAEAQVDGVRIPDAENVIATYPVAAVKASEHQAEAQAFIDLVASAQGQQVLHGYGFLPAQK
jgi:molybdate transport system substrate-binding protein